MEAPDELATQPAGSGPFELAEAVRGDVYRLEARDGYGWGFGGHSTSDPGFPSQIELRVVTDESTATNLFLTGELDLFNLSGRERERVREQAPDAVEGEHIRQTVVLFFNQGEEHVTSDPAVRRALAMAFDRVAFAQVATNEPGNEATSFIAPTTPCFDPTLEEAIPPYDPEGAADVLAEAGWERGPDGRFTRDGAALSVEFLLSGSRTPGGEYVLEALEDFGAAVTTRDVDFNTFLDTVFSGADFDFALLPLTAGNAPTPRYAAAYFTGAPPPDGTNFTRGENPEATAAAQEAQASVGDARCDAWVEAQRLLLDDVDFVPMANTPRSWFAQGLDYELTAYGNVHPVSIQRRS